MKTIPRAFAAISLALIAGASAPYAIAGDEEAVYKIVSSEDPNTSYGVAVLLSEERGVFVTAGHLVIDASKMRLARGEVTVPFSVTLQGNNVDKTIDDWAVLRAEGDAWEEARPLLDAEVAYTYPTYVDLHDTTILTARGAASFPSAVQWELQSNSDPCSVQSPILVEASQYDKGDSGSPVFMTNEGRSTVVAITSRFRATTDDMSDAERELVELFYRSSQPTASQTTADEALDDNTLRTLLKDKVLVKLVPTKCIIDAIVDQFQDAIFFDVKSNDFAVKFAMHLNLIRSNNFETPSEEIKKQTKRTYEFVNMLKTRNFEWMEVIRLWKAFFDSLGNVRVTNALQPMLLYDGLTSASERAQIGGIASAFFLRSNNASQERAELESLQKWASIRKASVQGDTPMLRSFLAANSAWQGADRRPLSTSRVVPLRQIADYARISLGKDLALALSDSHVTGDVSAETRAAGLELATSLLVTPRDNEYAPGRLQDTREALDGLQILLGIVRKGSDVSLKDNADYLFKQVLNARLAVDVLQREHKSRMDNIANDLRPQEYVPAYANEKKEDYNQEFFTDPFKNILTLPKELDPSRE